MSLLNSIALPNIRKLFVPDPGYTICDTDLDRADLQVVVWEAEDDLFKQALRAGVDIHILNGISLEGIAPPPLEELVETHPTYPQHKERFKRQRQLAKAFCHGTNYGGGARTMAGICGISIPQCERLQAQWFEAHPGIKAWHERTYQQLLHTKSVSNKFGYTRRYFDRVEGLLPEALAWVPQSTVGLYINKIWDTVVTNLPDIQILIQVHDSLVWSCPTAVFAERKEQFRALAATVVIPYTDPLIIPVGFKSSTISWGDCA